jgi:hypothetical protein
VTGSRPDESPELARIEAVVAGLAAADRLDAAERLLTTLVG